MATQFPRYGKLPETFPLISTVQLQDTLTRGGQERLGGFGLRELGSNTRTPRQTPDQFVLPIPDFPLSDFERSRTSNRLSSDIEV